MSRHIELKDDAFLTKGLRLHGLSVDTPSQLSDAFRSGALYGRDTTQESSAAQGAMTTEALSGIERLRCNFVLTDVEAAAVVAYFDAQPSDATAQQRADESLYALIASDEFAATFQTLGQYRKALLANRKGE